MTESPPLRPRSQRRSNPFSEACRNNFPSLENAFSVAPTKGCRGGSGSSSDDFQSVCSHGSSFLNMSIGIMASLADHMRHVAKYGIDGEKTSELTADTTENVEADINTSRNSLDEKWNYLLDNSNIKTDGSFAAIFENATGVDLSFAGTDTSCDYFNTSRVKGLETPERARDMRGIVSTREDEYYFEGEEEDDDDNEEASRSSPFYTDQECIEGLSRTLSFESLNNVNISHISNAGSEFLRRNNPEDSFQEPENTFNFLNIASPGSRLHQDSSFSSTPKKKPFDTRDTTPSLLGFSSRSNQKSYLPPRRPQYTVDKENNTVNRSFDNRNKSGTKATSTQKALEIRSRDFINAIGGGAGDEDDPSPISLAPTTPSPENDKLDSPHLTGRRKYRTVVPRRVFLDSPEDFPEEQDSFSFLQDDEEDDNSQHVGHHYKESDFEDYEDGEEGIIFSAVQSLAESFDALFVA